MVEWVLASLAAGGVEQAVLSLGYRPEAFRAAYDRAEVAGLEVRVAVEPELLDTAGAIRFAATAAGIGPEETFVALNGDVLADLDLRRLLATHERLRAERGVLATIALVAVEDPSRFGVAELGEDDRIRAFVEKPAPGHAPSNLVNAGWYVLEGSVLEHVEPGRRVSIERELFPLLAAEGRLAGLACDGYWLDAGTPEAYLRAHDDLLEGRRRWPVGWRPPEPRPGLLVEDGARVLGDVVGGSYLASSAIVEAGAVVIASSLGRQAVVRTGAVVTRSVLLEGAVVGAGALVSRSVLGAGAEVGQGATVEACSVLGDGATVQTRARLAGARLAPGERAPS
jgi:mannose-1-phosphate guanylyltransferase